MMQLMIRQFLMILAGLGLSEGKPQLPDQIPDYINIALVRPGSLIDQYIKSIEYGLRSWDTERKACIELLDRTLCYADWYTTARDLEGRKFRSGSWILDECNICYCVKGELYCEELTDVQTRRPNCYNDQGDYTGGSSNVTQLKRHGECSYYDERLRDQRTREEGEVWRVEHEPGLCSLCNCCHGTVVCYPKYHECSG